MLGRPEQTVRRAVDRLGLAERLGKWRYVRREDVAKIKTALGRQ